MPTSEDTIGSQTATLATDHTLVTKAGPTGGAVYQLRVDTNNLVGLETVTLTLQTRARTTDTTRTLYRSTFGAGQSDPIKDSPAIAVPSGNQLVAILRQENGTGRAFPWALLRLDG